MEILEQKQTFTENPLLFNDASDLQLLCVCVCVCVRAKLLQSCLVLCNPDPMDCSLPGSSVHGILQAIKLEWVVMSSSRASSRPKIEPASLMSPALAGGFFTTSTTGEAPLQLLRTLN